MQTGSNNQLMSDINITPFVDVMLVLLIIFMVTAPMMTQGVNVNLPEATNEELPSQQQEPLIISIDAAQDVYINDSKVALDFLREKLIKILENRKDREVYVRADKDIPYGIVIRVMSEVKNAGVEKLGMLTLPPEEDHKPKKS
ncbi:MAG: protein TolR [Desulfobacterales bacterium]|jgi:biopolymer transport protein TolR|nr:protein TolR [Desulfobacterales bacterium]